MPLLPTLCFCENVDCLILVLKQFSCHFRLQWLIKMGTINRLLLLVVAVATVQVSLCQNYDDWIVTAQNIGEDIILNCCKFISYILNHFIINGSNFHFGYSKLVSIFNSSFPLNLTIIIVKNKKLWLYTMVLKIFTYFGETVDFAQ